MFQQVSLAGKNFESPKGPLFPGNKISFNADSTFRYAGYGPSVFVSAGYWRYDKVKNEIEVTSDAKLNTLTPGVRFDSGWVDLSGKKINIKSANAIIFNDIVYKLKQ